MAFSPETFDELWGLEYAAFDPDATYSLHPIVFLKECHIPHAATYELGVGDTLRFRELGAFAAQAEKLVERSKIDAEIAGVVLTNVVENVRSFTASILLTPATQVIELKAHSFVSWLYGPPGSGTARHQRWFNRVLEPAIAINRIPEPVGYAEVAGDIVACVPTAVPAKRRRPHLAIYRSGSATLPLVNALSSDPYAMKQRLTAGTGNA